MTGLYPFDSLSEFERFRSTGLEDLTAAQTLLQLRRSSASRSVIRIYYGPPGTGKTLRAVQAAVELADPAFPDQADFGACFQQFAGPLAKQVAFITFHQSLQYEDVVESIRPSLENVPDLESEGEEEAESGNAGEEEGESTGDGDGRGSQLKYKLHAGPIMRMIRRAIDTPSEEHVLVIDEINRGDISRILGPLISSLEPDKRLGAEFPIGFESQYPRASGPGSRIFMPANLHVIGTMNSADRNIALVDHALRRRFEFVEVPPEPHLLGETADSQPLNLKELLRALNQRIAFLLDKDHMIGHGYLLGCETNADAIERFARRVLPLLSEYFYGNEAGLLLVLGDTATGPSNVHVVKQSEETFEQIFGQPRDAALELGYRSGHSQLSISVDPRFWEATASPPAPADEAYAVAALRKIYERTVAPAGTQSVSTAATAAGPTQTTERGDGAQPDADSSEAGETAA